MLSVQQVIRTMWHSMMSFPATEPTDMIQQDLIGFFNSVPHDPILQALTYTLFLLQANKSGGSRGRSNPYSSRSATRTRLFGFFEDVADLRLETPGLCIWRTYRI